MPLDSDEHVRSVPSGPSVQRRDAVRARVAIRPRLAARVFGRHRTPLRLGITNVSAGGLQLRSQDELRVGDTLLVTFPLEGYFEELTVHVQVRRVQRQLRRDHLVWDAGCVFEPLPPRLIDVIVQYVFAQLRAEARRRAEHQP